MHESSPHAGYDTLAAEVARLKARNDKLERGLDSVARVVEALAGPVMPASAGDELAARRQRRAAFGDQWRHAT